MLSEIGLAVVMFVQWYLFSGIPSDPEGHVRSIEVIQLEYDFVVIGAGSSGSVIANRLTEVPDWNVLLLEAGGEEPISGQIPALAAGLQLTNVDWQYKTTTQPNRACLAMNNQECLWPRGKVLGGSSSINYMLYVRGNKRDYDQWAALGNTGWSYDDVLPYFIKSEDNRNPYLANSKYHGTGGYLTVDDIPFRTPLAAAFVQGGVEMGYENRDCNGEFQTGFMFAQGTTRRSRRCSTAKAFLRPVRNRRNLHISMNSHVLKLVIDPDTKTATGVRFERKGKIYNVKATKEVILSAGVVASPQILMLSGIGPAAHLADKGIGPIIADLPVGDNLQDHVAVGGMVFLMDKTYSVIEDRYLNLPTVLNYTVRGGTVFSLLGGVEALAWIKTKYADLNDDWPDIQLHFAGGSDVSDGGMAVRYGHGVSDAVWNEYYQPIVNRDSWSALVNVLRPKSRGTIRLSSTDPYDKPVIDPNYYSDPQDLKTTIEGFKFVLALSKTEAFQSVGTKFYDKTFPGCEDFTLWTDDYWACVIKSYSFTLAHTGGTCKMGPDSDPDAVVDPQLRLRGVKNLRVVDSSIMPLLPSGNTNAAAIMIGEKASDLIKNTWQKRK